MEDTLKFIGAIVAYILLTIYSGWVVSHLWNWILVPSLQLPVIGVSAAVGIKFMANVLTHRGKAKTKDSMTDVFVNSFVYTSVALFIGWVISFYIA